MVTPVLSVRVGDPSTTGLSVFPVCPVFPIDSHLCDLERYRLGNVDGVSRQVVSKIGGDR